MTLPIIVTIFFAAIFIIGIYARQNTQLLKRTLASLEKTKADLEEKLQAARDSSSKAKLELQRKEQSLTELREQMQSKLRKFAQKIERVSETQGQSSQGEDVVAALEKTIATLRLQLEQANEEALTSAKVAFAEQDGARKSEITSLNNALAQSKAENQKLRTKLEGVKGSSHLSQLGINIDELPLELVQEISRLYHKAQQNQNMKAIVQSKFNLVNEKYSEMQRKYFDVCRQLAMTMGQEVEASAAPLPTEPSAS